MASEEEPEWPEFRQWYALMLQYEELLGRAEPSSDEEADAIQDAMNALDQTMRERRPRSFVNIAILGVLSLYWADKERGQSPERVLELGCDCNLDSEYFGERPQGLLIEAVVRMAVERNLLPGVKIYGEGGNA
jgi:hypothetical protein